MDRPIQLLRNDAVRKYHYLKVRLEGRAPNTEALGAFVTVEAGGITQRQPVYSGAAYLSTHERVLLYGLGEATSVTRVHVKWPSGKEQVVPAAGVKVDSLLVIREES